MSGRMEPAGPENRRTIPSVCDWRSVWTLDSWSMPLLPRRLSMQIGGCETAAVQLCACRRQTVLIDVLGQR
ncbi:hypothetical protein BN949_02756 [Agrobacterium tumefaciens]|nr:hypothetical protein BN949_02756 [Agrobacterium tumefaciens]